MVKGKKKEYLTTDWVLKRVDQYDIYRFYIGKDFKIGESLNSPFRRDSSPSFTIVPTKSGTLHHMDYADTSKSGDCFNFVEQLFGIGITEALKKIDWDMGLGFQSHNDKDYKIITSDYQKPEEEKKDTIIQVVSRKFNAQELAYWNDYHVDADRLKRADVYAIKKLFINKQVVSLGDSLVFGYLFGDKWKIYWPNEEKTKKWKSNVSGTTMSGLYKITDNCNTAFIVKSKKDELVCEQIIPETCSVQSENTISISEENIKMFQKKCKRTIVGFDPDETGVAACKHYNQFGFGYVNIPKDVFIGLKCKDFADYAKRFGMKDLELFFKSKKVI